MEEKVEFSFGKGVFGFGGVVTCFPEVGTDAVFLFDDFFGAVFEEIGGPGAVTTRGTGDNKVDEFWLYDYLLQATAVGGGQPFQCPAQRNFQGRW